MEQKNYTIIYKFISKSLPICASFFRSSAVMSLLHIEGNRLYSEPRNIRK